MSILCSMVGASFTVAAAAEIIRKKIGVSAGGNAQISTAQSQFGGTSAIFDGAGDFLSLPDTATNTSDYTFECWARFDILPHNQTLDGGAYIMLSTGSGSDYFMITRTGAGSQVSIQVAHANAYGSFTKSGVNYAINTWYHIAVVRNSGVFKVFFNGTDLTTFTNDSGFTNSGRTQNIQHTIIGKFTDNRGSMDGYMDEVRVSKSARYTADYTPPTAPFVNDDNTLVLIHTDGTNASTFFEDDNGLTRAPINAWQPESGVVISSTQSKFGGTSLFTPGEVTLFHNQYSGASNGNALINFGTGDFTVEFWIYPTSTATTSGVITKRNISNVANGTWGIRYNGSTRVVTWENIFPSVTSTSTSGSAYTASTWSHWAFVRSSGTLKIYVDGVEKASASNSLDFTFNSEPIRIGDWGAGGTNSHIGYLDELRMSNSARYTAAFTPSTTPFVNDANTLLLMHMDGTPSVAVFRDDNGIGRSAKGISANGNAQVSTAQSQFGGASAFFDGTGDFLKIFNNETIGTGNFTVECWLRKARLGTQETILDIRNGVDGQGWFVHQGGPNKIAYYTASDFRLVHQTVLSSTSTWYHIAWVRNSGTVTIYIDGVASTTTLGGDTQNYNNANWFIGGANDGTNYINAYIDEFRVSNTARYTTTFTPSTTPFQNDANTLLLIHANGTNGSTVFTDDNGTRPV